MVGAPLCKHGVCAARVARRAPRVRRVRARAAAGRSPREIAEIESKRVAIRGRTAGAATHHRQHSHGPRGRGGGGTGMTRLRSGKKVARWRLFGLISRYYVRPKT